MAEEEAAEVPPEPVPALSEEDFEARQTIYEDIFAEFPALEVKQKSMAERKEKEAAPPPVEEGDGEEPVAPPPEVTPNIALAYSELNFAIVNKLINTVKEKCGPLFPGKGMFLDFGSGAGKLCIAAGLIHPFEKIVGIETLQCLNDVEAAALAKYGEAQLPEGIVKPEVSFIKGDFVTEFDANLETVAPEVKVAIVNATTFGEPEMQAVTKLAQKMPEGSSLIMVTQMLEESLVVNVNRDPEKRRAAATKKLLAKRGVEPDGIEIVLDPAENDPNGWRLKHTEVLELEWGTTSCYLYKKYTYPFCDPGDICMATPLPETNDTGIYPAYFVGPTSARYLDDGTETPCEMSKIDPFSEEDNKKAVELYKSKLDMCKKAESDIDSKSVVAVVFEKMRETFPETVSEDGNLPVGYVIPEEPPAEGAAEAHGTVLLRLVLENFMGMPNEATALKCTEMKWKEACKEADPDETGKISEEAAVSVFDQAKAATTKFIESKLAELEMLIMGGGECDRGEPASASPGGDM